MNNMYEILNKFKSVADSQQLDTSKKPATKTINEAASKQIDELSPSTLTSYRHKARNSELRSAETARRDTEISQQARDPRVRAKSAAYAAQAQATADKRRAGQEKATSRLSREDKIKESSMMPLDMILQKHSRDFDAFKQGGDLSDSLYNSLYDYYFDDMPYGVKKARTGDPYEWVSQRLHDEMGLGEGNRFAFNVLKAKQQGLKKADLDGDGDLEAVREAGKPMTPKQKSFAKLAPPRDKITFADKIAGAKQEVDEMLGDVAAEAMKSAVQKMEADSHQAKTTMKHVNASGASAKEKAAIGKAAKDIKSGVAGYRDREAALKAAGVVDDRGPQRESRDDDDDDYYGTKQSHKTASGGTVTRHGGVTKHQAAPGRYGGYDPETDPDKDDDKSEKSGEKRGRGRPKGTGKSIGAKGPSGKSKLLNREGAGEESSEVAKAKALLKKAGYTVSKDGEEELDEKAVSKKQQKFMGMVHAAQKGEKPASKEVAKVAKSMGKKDAEDFAATKHKGLPEKKKKEVEETTTAGGIAPAPGGKANSMFGKGVYEAKIAESFNKHLDTVLTEGMSVNMNVDVDGKKSLTVTATDDDAVALSKLLSLAGINGSAAETPMAATGESCDSCGSTPCACDHVEETLANSPDAQYSDVDTMINKLSGGLNRRKSTGQTTAPVVNRDPARGSIGTVTEEAEKRLWEIYSRYQAK